MVLPEGYDPEAEYPVLLALPPGGQTEEMVDWGLRLYWTAGPAPGAGWS